MSDVLFLKRGGYDREGIASAIEAIFSHFGGAWRLVKPGDKVLLKVNLVAGHEPERRVTTDPSVVRAVARVVLNAGAHPVIADSPGLDNFPRAAQKPNPAKSAKPWPRERTAAWLPAAESLLAPWFLLPR